MRVAIEQSCVNDDGTRLAHLVVKGAACVARNLHVDLGLDVVSAILLVVEVHVALLCVVKDRSVLSKAEDVIRLAESSSTHIIRFPRCTAVFPREEDFAGRIGGDAGREEGCCVVCRKNGDCKDDVKRQALVGARGLVPPCLQHDDEVPKGELGGFCIAKDGLSLVMEGVLELT